MGSAIRLSDGTYDFSAGVDSGKVTMLASEVNPNGLKRNQLAWLDSGSVRSGGISNRKGFQSLAKVAAKGLYQGGYMYQPDFAFPYLMLSVSGVIYRVILGQDYSTSNVTNITAGFPGTQNPPAAQQTWMTQGEQFLIIQPGDLTAATPTNPLFWDGAKLWRSEGITNTSVGTGTPGVNGIPAAGPMIYYQGRIWYAQGRQYSASDIVYGNSGTSAYNFRDSILNVTENPLSVGGDGFAVPSSAGNITALFYAATIDTTLGQGSLYVSTARQIFQTTVPVTRANWIATNSNNQPVQVPVQLAWGASSDRCVAQVNGDVFYQSLEPGIRSLALCTRFSGSWTNMPVSRNIQRALKYQDRQYMSVSSTVDFNNRLYAAILPVNTVVGPAFQAIAVLDFDIVSSFQGMVSSGGLLPAWEGILEGLDILQLFTGVFGGQPRCFAAVHSKLDDSIEVWELTDTLLSDNNPVNRDSSGNRILDNRIDWYFETPSYTFAREFDMKELDGGELWVDNVSGTVDMTVKFRVDGDPCWQFWTFTQFCAARNQNEVIGATPVQYPSATQCKGWQFPITLPAPQINQCQSDGSRPAKIGYQFQVQVTIKGACRVRGLIIHAIPRERRPFEGLTCSTQPTGGTA